MELLSRASLSALIVMVTLVISARGALANDDDEAIAACLGSWGTHPFGSHPNYELLGTSVKVFGIGTSVYHSEATREPALILVKPGVNVLGESTISLLNPNGWYCLRANVNVLGGMNIRLSCNARLASSIGGATVIGDSPSNRGVTVLGTTKVELIDCPSR